MRIGDFNAPGIKGVLDPAVHFPTDGPLVDRNGLNPEFDDDRGVSEAVYSQHFQWGQNFWAKIRVRLKSGADVWLVRYDPAHRPVAIHAGENAGRTIDHRNLVIELTRLGKWSGEAKQLSLPEATKAGLASALLVQAPDGGPIISAAKLTG